MAPLVLAALKLAPYIIPEALRALSGDKAAEAAEKVISVAKTVTGQDDPTEATEAVLADPAAQLKLQELLSAERLEFARLAVKELEIAAQDRDSARKREIEVRDRTPAIMAYLVTVGFFGVLAYLLVAGKPAMGGDALLVMLGSLGTAWTAIISYFYGSSAGSESKTRLLAGKS